MSNYRLMPKEGTCTFHKIMHARRWVGRVYPHADGTWRCAINKHEVGNGTSAFEAFSNGVAKHLGYANVAELREHNSLVRRRNKLRKQEAQRLMQRMLGGDFSVIDELLRR